MALTIAIANDYGMLAMSSALSIYGMGIAIAHGVPMVGISN